MIVFDTPRPVRFRGFRRTAHLMSDFADPAEASIELDRFATRIGLSLAWVQHRGTEREHYDLFDAAIEWARAAGAVEVTPRELIARIVQPRRETLRARDRFIPPEEPPEPR